MADGKYGRIFTEGDVIAFTEQVAKHYHRSGEPPTVAQIQDHLEQSEGTFPKDEPQFVLRGQDKAAHDTVESYLYATEEEGAGEAVIQGVKEALSRFKAFAAGNRDRMKVAD